MKVLIQRVRRASVTVGNETVGRIDLGYAVLLGVRTGDSIEDARKMASKTLNLRIFPDGESRMNRSITDVHGSILVISQFTLYADTRKGNRPGFSAAADPAMAERVYEEYVGALRTEIGAERVPTGRFGAHMIVEIVNDGPVTVELTTDPV